MRPGQHSPGSCKQIYPNTPELRSFKFNENYGLHQPLEPPIRPVARQPLPDLTCIMETTPYLENLKTTLDKFLNRPPTIHNQLRHLLVTKCIQQYTFFVILFIVIGTGALRLFGLYLISKMHHSWEDFFILNPVAALFPLLPFMFPMLWITINLWGAASLETLLTIPQPLMQVEKTKSFQQNLDTPTCEIDYPQLSKREIFANWIHLVNGGPEMLTRSANIVQVLGSISVSILRFKPSEISKFIALQKRIYFLFKTCTSQEFYCRPAAIFYTFSIKNILNFKINNFRHFAGLTKKEFYPGQTQHQRKSFS